MSDQERKFLEFADKCDEHARRAKGDPLASQFRSLALQWRELAAIVRQLAADSQQAAEFFKAGR
jgi:outer membrane murein-binding lipoprotein Lpp